jgi:hypothetical protein
VVTLRFGSVIKDDAIPALLLKAAQPTFVTINPFDFWKQIQPHHGYCVIVADLPKERLGEIPALLRQFFRMSEFKTKASRMGKIVRLTPRSIEYYESDRRVQLLQWPDVGMGR